MAGHYPKFPEWEGTTCGYCGAENEPGEPIFYRLVCPECKREGCHECMPLGSGCKCPECEEGEG